MFSWQNISSVSFNSRVRKGTAVEVEKENIWKAMDLVELDAGLGLLKDEEEKSKVLKGSSKPVLEKNGDERTLKLC